MTVEEPRGLDGGDPIVEEPRARELIDGGAAFPLVGIVDRWDRPLPEVRPPVVPPVQIPTVECDRLLARGEVRERELSPELYADLRKLTPQALLRDLHRPVNRFAAVLEPIEGTRASGAMHEASAEIRAARRLEALPRVASSIDVVADDRARRSRLLTDPWEPILTDAAPRRTVVLRPAEDE